MVEHCLDKKPTETRCLRMKWTQKPMDDTRFGGILDNVGAKSTTWMEATDRQWLGADDLGLLDEIKSNGSGKTPWGIVTNGPKHINTQE